MTSLMVGGVETTIVVGIQLMQPKFKVSNQVLIKMQYLEIGAVLRINQP